MKTSFIQTIGLSIIIACSLTACFSDQPTIPDVPTPPTNTRAPKALTLDRVFLELPSENIQLESIKTLSKKYRKELLESGKLNTLHSTQYINSIWLDENFQSEDDPSETASKFSMATFEKPDGPITVFMTQQRRHEQRNELELVAQDFWSFDGKNWENISTTIPKIETKHFFKEGFDLPNFKNEYILLEPDSINQHQINATLQYELYAKHNPNIPIHTLVENEHYHVVLEWNGKEFKRYQNEIH